MESCTCAVKVVELGAVAVPEIRPLLLNDKPEGSVPDPRFQVYGALPPAAVKVVLYATPTTPSGTVAVVMVNTTAIARLRLCVAC